MLHRQDGVAPRDLSSHSAWTPGEDIETGRVAHALGMRVRHCDVVVRTEVPESWRALARQRRLWWAGTFRHWIVNVDRNLVQLPVFTLYLLAVIWASLYFRWWHMVDVSRFRRCSRCSSSSTCSSRWSATCRCLSPWMIVFPLYAFVQTLVFPAVGAVYYVVLALRRRRLGRYRFGYVRREWDAREATVVPRALSPARMLLALATCLLVGFSAGGVGGLGRLPVPVFACLVAAVVALVCANGVASRSHLFRIDGAAGSVACDLVLPLLLIGALAFLLLSASLSLVA